MRFRPDPLWNSYGMCIWFRFVFENRKQTQSSPPSLLPAPNSLVCYSSIHHISTRWYFHHRSNPPWRLKLLICQTLFARVFCCLGAEIPIDVVFDIALTLFYDLNLFGYLSAFAAWRVTNIPHAPNVGRFSHAHLLRNFPKFPPPLLPTELTNWWLFVNAIYKPVLIKKKNIT